MTVKEGRLRVGTTDENLATVEVTLDDGTVVHIEGVYVSDPENKNARQNVSPFNFGVQTRYAAQITGPELKELCDSMARLIEGQRLTNMILNRLISADLTADDLEDY